MTFHCEQCGAPLELPNHEIYNLSNPAMKKCEWCFTPTYFMWFYEPWANAFYLSQSLGI